MKPNIRRGLWRLYGVAAIGWIAVVAVLAYRDNLLRDPVITTEARNLMDNTYRRFLVVRNGGYSWNPDDERRILQYLKIDGIPSAVNQGKNNALDARDKAAYQDFLTNRYTSQRREAIERAIKTFEDWDKFAPQLSAKICVGRAMNFAEFSVNRTIVLLECICSRPRD